MGLGFVCGFDLSGVKASLRAEISLEEMASGTHRSQGSLGQLSLQADERLWEPGPGGASACPVGLHESTTKSQLSY